MNGDLSVIIGVVILYLKMNALKCNWKDFLL
ncbi:hypothetical protein SAMN05444380_11093 [Thermophagus xiamenensis]|uniref:Uncharacterized protein n=1 Tax=Thermophagus xiamenensis TaxID=385682 RepID=A0A1I2A1J8_9BACT|nr:hypothetical protein SAMN05444380_11093 [Thermophagus xiamenensis]